jgi:chemotaxis protein methyltransferase CheR
MRMRWEGFRRVRRQVCRRISSRLRELEIPDLDSYRDRLRRDHGEWVVLDTCCRVTISRFWRDRVVFEILGREVLPRLAVAALDHGRPALRVWSAGCASGEEPYSLLLLWMFELKSRFPQLDLEIEATDTDLHLLERARTGCYPAGSLRELPADWRVGIFEEKDKLFCLRRDLVSAVEFRSGDIRHTAPRATFDLVLCRNLAFTYYEEGLQVEVLRRIHSVLRRSGVLVVGSHETLPDCESSFEAEDGAPALYRRVG